MNVEKIASSVSATQQALRGMADAAGPDEEAVAILEDTGLRSRITGPGDQKAFADGPTGIGGDASAPNPGWLFRAGVASCAAAVIGMRAGVKGVKLDHLEVRVNSRSDPRGVLEVNNEIPIGFLDMSVHVKIRAAGVDPATLKEIAEWGIAHSPMNDACRRPVDYKLTTDAG